VLVTARVLVAIISMADVMFAVVVFIDIVLVPAGMLVAVSFVVEVVLAARDMACVMVNVAMTFAIVAALVDTFLELVELLVELIS
jgi:hypothetical protein